MSPTARLAPPCNSYRLIATARYCRLPKAPPTVLHCSSSHLPTADIHRHLPHPHPPPASPPPSPQSNPSARRPGYRLPLATSGLVRSASCGLEKQDFCTAAPLPRSLVSAQTALQPIRASLTRCQGFPLVDDPLAVPRLPEFVLCWLPLGLCLSLFSLPAILNCLLDPDCSLSLSLSLFPTHPPFLPI